MIAQYLFPQADKGKGRPSHRVWRSASGVYSEVTGPVSQLRRDTSSVLVQSSVCLLSLMIMFIDPVVPSK